MPHQQKLMDIQISFIYRKNNNILKSVSATLKRFAAIMNDRARVYVAFVDDPAIQKLNMQFRKRHKPTNVLSFEINQKDPEDGRIVMGEIIISVDTAAREAGKAGITLSERLEELFVHGYVHLLGYDHTRSRTDAMKMKNKEQILIKKIDMYKKKYNKRG